MSRFAVAVLFIVTVGALVAGCDRSVLPFSLRTRLPAAQGSS